MTGRVCLVTGGSSGVGKATALGLARLGASVVLVSRDPARGEQAREEIQSRTGNPRVDFLPCDLALQSDIRRLAREVGQRYGALHVLVNCAGTLALRRELTEEGVERTLALDYLDHFLLTTLLLDLLQKSAPARVLTVAGSPGPLRSLSFREDLLQRGGVAAALQAALARALFTFELARRLGGSGVTANAFHPGLVRTRLDRRLPWPLRLPVRLVQPLLSPECPTSVRLASSTELGGISGRFFAGRLPVSLEPHETDADTARRLWQLSERLTRVR